MTDKCPICGGDLFENEYRDIQCVECRSIVPFHESNWEVSLMTEQPKARLYRVLRGDRIFLYSDEEVRVGYQYKNYPAIVTKIDYLPKKWWQFWKKKKQVGFQIMWLANEATDEQLTDGGKKQ